MSDLLKNIFVKGTTYGALGGAAVAGVALAQGGAASAPGVDIASLPPQYMLWAFVATLVVQAGVEICKAFLNRGDKK